MRIKSLLILLMSLVVILPNSVDAVTFKDGDDTYELEKVEIDSTCLEGRSYTGFNTADGNYIFENDEDGDRQVKLLDDGTCKELTKQELLDYYNGVGYSLYDIVEDADGNYYISYTSFFGSGSKEVFVKTTDTEINPNKEYYEIEVGDGTLSSGPAESGDISNYYELVNLTRPKSIVEDTDLTYYTVSSMDVATVVEEFDENQVLEYFVLDDGSYKEKNEKVLDLPSSFKTLFENSRIYQAIKSAVDDKLYVIIEQEESRLYDIYNTDGEKLFSEVSSFADVNSLYAVTVDNTTKFYNFDKELVYELADSYVGASKANGKTSTILGYDLSDENEKFAIFKLQLKTNEIDNPQTFDNITLMFIILGISIIGIISTLIYLKKNKTRA